MLDMITKQKINVLLIVFVLLLVGFQSANSQNEDHSLLKNSRALQFAVGSNFNLHPFQDMMFSWKHHTSSNTAYRIGLDCKINIGNEQDYDDQETKDIDFSSSSFTLNIQRLKYMNINNPVKPYWGFGPSITVSNTNRDTDYYAAWLDQTFNLKHETQMWGIGGSGLFGIEWFPFKELGLSAEYAFSLNYEYLKTEEDHLYSEAISTNKTKESGLKFGSNGVTMGASFYF